MLKRLTSIHFFLFFVHINLKDMVKITTLEVIILFWTVGFILTWIVWLIFANKERWKEI